MHTQELAAAFAMLWRAGREGKQAARGAYEWQYVALFRNVEEEAERGLKWCAHQLAEEARQRGTQLELVDGGQAAPVRHALDDSA